MSFVSNTNDEGMHITSPHRSSSGLVASAMRRARYRSMVPADSAARVATRHRSATPRPVHAIAAGCDITSSRPTVDPAAAVAGAAVGVDADAVVAGGGARGHLRDRGEFPWLER